MQIILHACNCDRVKLSKFMNVAILEAVSGSSRVMLMGGQDVRGSCPRKLNAWTKGLIWRRADVISSIHLGGIMDAQFK